MIASRSPSGEILEVAIVLFLLVLFSYEKEKEACLLCPANYVVKRSKVDLRVSIFFSFCFDCRPSLFRPREREPCATRSRSARDTNSSPMSKKAISASIRLLIGAGQAKPAPPVGPALGQAGLNIMAFCKDFNAATSGIKVSFFC